MDKYTHDLCMEEFERVSEKLYPSDKPNGSGGIARKGREEEYATELWLEGPSAFWLHPEGPLSDTTPDEWREKQQAKKKSILQDRAYLGMNGAMAQRHAMMAQAQLAQAQYTMYQHQMQRQSNLSPLANLFGNLIY